MLHSLNDQNDIKIMNINVEEGGKEISKSMLWNLQTIMGILLSPMMINVMECKRRIKTGIEILLVEYDVIVSNCTHIVYTG